MQYEPTIEELRHKYEVAMKEKMLVRLEKDRLQAHTEALEAQVPPLAPFPPPWHPSRMPAVSRSWQAPPMTLVTSLLWKDMTCHACA